MTKARLGEREAAVRALKLSPSQRRAIFLRWLAGNQLLASGGVPETMAEIGEAYGVTKQAVAWIVRDLGGRGNRRASGRKIRPCSTPGCGATAVAYGRCRNHYESWKRRMIRQGRWVNRGWSRKPVEAA